MQVQVKKLTENAKLPTYGSDGAAGLDLYADLTNVEDAVTVHIPQNGEMVDQTYVDIPPHTNAKISSGVAFAIPRGYFGGVYARSGKATKENLRPANCVGVVDSDYRGDCIVVIYNDSLTDTRRINQGDKVGQLIIQPVPYINLEEVEELTETERGTNGFGSTDGKDGIEATGDTSTVVDETADTSIDVTDTSTDTTIVADEEG